MENQNSNHCPKIVDAKEIQEILGISEATLIRAKKRGDIPYLVINGTHRYNVEKVIQALEEKAMERINKIKRSV